MENCKICVLELLLWSDEIGRDGLHYGEFAQLGSFHDIPMALLGGFPHGAYV